VPFFLGQKPVFTGAVYKIRTCGLSRVKRVLYH
jgi:hypothetical protein